MSDPIIGKRIILFNIESADLEHFIKLHQEDKNGMMGRFCLREMTDDEARNYIVMLIATGQIRVWACMSKEGRASKRVGYIYLTDISPFSCKVVGILDKAYIKGLSKILKRDDKYTFSEDALRTMLAWCFNGAGFNRVEYRTLKNNLLSMRLAEKAGFVKEGVLRKSFRIDGEYLDIAVYSVLKNEYKLPEGKEKEKKE